MPQWMLSIAITSYLVAFFYLPSHSVSLSFRSSSLKLLALLTIIFCTAIDRYTTRLCYCSSVSMRLNMASKNRVSMQPELYTRPLSLPHLDSIWRYCIVWVTIGTCDSDDWTGRHASHKCCTIPEWKSAIHWLTLRLLLTLTQAQSESYSRQ